MKDMGLTRKTIRVDERISAAFAEWCQRAKKLQEGATEALFVYAITQLNSEKIGALVDAATAWKAAKDADAAAASASRTGGKQAGTPPRRA